ncbi:MAG: CRISPR-associated endonuclease Cas1, partial [Calditrichia bacterium]
MKNREKIYLYPMESLSTLVLVGRIEISAAMMGILMGRGIEVIYLSSDGRFKGRVISAAGKNIQIREKQFALRREPAFVLTLSKEIVQAKIRNSRNLIRRHNPGIYQGLAYRVQNALNSTAASADIERLRGIEGSFAALYYTHFAALLKNRMGFRKRRKHPPPDPVNILLSFGYTLLFNNIFALVESTGMDPYAGFYHQSRYGHPALISDLMEPFRARVVDQFVIGLINNQLILAEHFVKSGKSFQF